MRILFVSMPAIHAVRWIENLKDSEHELYWFDVLGKGNLVTSNSLGQIVNWKKRKLPYVKGEFFLRKRFPDFYFKIQPFLEITASEKLSELIEKIKPDIVQSFEMQSCSYAIYETMLKYPQIKWVYNCWGNDIFYFQRFVEHRKKVKQVLSRVDYMIADCNRDYFLAKNNGLKGDFLVSIPTGGGYDLLSLEKYRYPLENRKYIIVKGYHHRYGRGLNIVKALSEINEKLKNYEIVIFGAHKIVEDYVINNDLNYKVYNRHGLKQEEVLEIMGQSLIYLGNSISDGMPNTLLEAIIMGAFPIQSNPGGVTKEIINHGENGFLIENPEEVSEIKILIERALASPSLLKKAQLINQNIAKERLDYEVIRQKIVALYNKIENKL